MSVENKKPLRAQLSQLVKENRLLQGLTQKELADKYNEKYGTNWGKMCVSDIEHGRASLETFDKVFECLKVSVDIQLELPEYHM